MTDTIARYYPAQVLIDGAVQRKRYVVLARNGPEDGLWVFARPDDPGTHERVDWAATTVPSARDARNGFDVMLTDGRVVVITNGVSCRCGALGRWRGPAWATSVAVRA